MADRHRNESIPTRPTYPPKYFQVAGFQGHIDIYQRNYTALSREIARRGSLRSSTGDIELVLGIMPSGASYVLMSEAQAFKLSSGFCRQLHSISPSPSSKFVSLSPITFRGEEQLQLKLSTYKQKKAKGNISSADNSQANKKYCLPGSIEVLERAFFEHSRVLYRVVRGQDVSNFCQPGADLRRLRVVSLAINFWTSDYRPNEEKKTNPMFLDIGWAEGPATCLCNNQYECAITYIRLNECTHLGNKGLKRQDFNGGTCTLDRLQIVEKLRQLLDSTTSEPLLLLVHDKQKTFDVLNSCNIYESTFTNDLSSLLGHRWKLGPTVTSQNNRDHRHRSRSPSRQRRGRSDSPMPTLKKAYLVDIREQYCRLMDEVGSQGLVSIRETADRLGLPVDKGVWCAGEECQMLLEMWRSMAESQPIDEQRESRRSAQQLFSSNGAQSSMTVLAQANQGGSDDGLDPNDVPVITQTTAGSKSAPDDYSDDSDDY